MRHFPAGDWRESVLPGNADRREQREWDGTNWTSVTPAGIRPPQPTVHPAAAFDTRRRVFIISACIGTWEWDGVNWSNPASSPGGPTRSAAAGAFVPCLERFVTFGGRELVTLDEMSFWDGVAWTHPVTPVLPPARAEGVMTYDSVRDKLVLFSGRRDPSTLAADTWEY